MSLSVDAAEVLLQFYFLNTYIIAKTAAGSYGWAESFYLSPLSSFI